MPENREMNNKEFIKKIQSLGKKRGVPIKKVSQRGKGGHITLFYGEKFTIVSTSTKELKPGTLNAMLKQLCIKKDDLGYQ